MDNRVRLIRGKGMESSEGAGFDVGILENDAVRSEGLRIIKFNKEELVCTHSDREIRVFLRTAYAHLSPTRHFSR